MYTEKKDKVAAVFSYLGWIFWIIAFIIRDKYDEFQTHHLNQALMINLLKIAGGLCVALPHVGDYVSSAVGVAALVLLIMGIYRAVNWRTDPLPFIGEFHLVG